MDGGMQCFQLTLSEAHTHTHTATQHITIQDNTSEHGRGRNPVALWNVPCACLAVRDTRAFAFSVRGKLIKY